MNRKTITIQTNTLKKGKLDQRSFTAQILELGKSRIYVLDDSKNAITRKRFDLTPGCRIFDDSITLDIQDIQYWKAPMYPFLVTFPESQE